MKNIYVNGRPLPCVEPTGRVRVTVFPDRAECILLHVSEGQEVALPALKSPFRKAEIAAVLKRAGIRCDVTESVPGRWTQAASKMALEERAERHQIQRQKEATMLALDRSGSPLARTRAEALAKKHVVDDRIREIKAWLAQARTNFHTRGLYKDPVEYRGKEHELLRLKEDSQALQTRLGELREQEKAQNRVAEREEGDRFRAAAHKVLTAEQLEAVLMAMEDDEDEDEDEDGK